MFVPLFLCLIPDSTLVRSIPTAPRESLTVTIAGEGRPVVIIPGLAGNAFAFRKVIPPLVRDGLQVVVIEPLGVGWSSRPSNADYSLTAQADRIAAIMDTLGLTSSLVVAHSVSVSMALRLVVRHPERVEQVLAIDGGPDEKLATAGVRKAVQLGFLIRLFAGRGRIKKEMRKRFVASSGDTTWITPEVIDGYTAGGAGDIGAVLRTMKGWLQAVEPDSVTPHLSEIQVPVHLLLGTAPHEAGVSPSKVRVMRTHIPHFAVDSVPGAGLHIHEEQPDAVVREILKLEGKEF
jgi:pimeloyl-ACP methyl ester carboxylesterase